MNDSYKFQIVCKNAIINYYREEYGIELNIKDVYVVWLCKTLQNSKALLSTNIEDSMYYECTYNGNTDEIYLDSYKKDKNIVISSSKFNTKVEYKESE